MQGAHLFARAVPLVSLGLLSVAGRSFIFTRFWWVWGLGLLVALGCVGWVLVTGSGRRTALGVLARGGVLWLGGFGQDWAFDLAESCLTRRAEAVLAGHSEPKGRCREIWIEPGAPWGEQAVSFEGAVPLWYELGLDEVGLVYAPLSHPNCSDVGAPVDACNLRALGDGWWEYRFLASWNS